MDIAESSPFAEGDHSAAADQRRAALAHVVQAFEEGRREGLDGDCLAQAALFAALSELVDTYGEEAVARFCDRLPDRVEAGEFTIPGQRH